MQLLIETQTQGADYTQLKTGAAESRCGLLRRRLTRRLSLPSCSGLSRISCVFAHRGEAIEVRVPRLPLGGSMLSLSSPPPPQVAPSSDGQP